ncbi:MAG: cell division ATP-binding protein FtsE [Calditrichaeota bacterium]|nr:MAG: cell division ATP-binding protein FtsE [Calditrichota bacterium]MBL1205429.1 cell division ATP-binding protein FtsE [Calditrichota bacterium]NOG45258.1 cell division ATP-binding protein FtsE [Calditrichota bacterium]
MIEFYNVHTKIDKNVILKNITFRILKGEFVFLTGSSGAGKSTVLRHIYMDIIPEEGMVIVENFSSAKIKEKEIPLLRRKLGVVFQDFKLLSDRNVFENVAFALRVTGAKSNEIKRKVMRVLAEVNLGQKRNFYPRELSGGEQQRVAIARAIVNNPFIILADEPTGNLDSENTFEIMDILEKINRQGTAVLMATHSEEILTKYRHRKITVDNGAIG